MKKIDSMCLDFFWLISTYVKFWFYRLLIAWIRAVDRPLFFGLAWPGRPTGACHWPSDICSFFIVKILNPGDSILQSDPIGIRRDSIKILLQWITIIYTSILSFFIFLSSISPMLSFHSYYFFSLTSIILCIPFLHCVFLIHIYTVVI